MPSDTTPSPPASSSPSGSRTPSPVSPACWATHAATVVIALVLGRPLVQAVVTILTHAIEHKDPADWKILGAATAVLLVLLAPVPTANALAGIVRAWRSGGGRSS